MCRYQYSMHEHFLNTICGQTIDLNIIQCNFRHVRELDLHIFETQRETDDTVRLSKTFEQLT